MTPYLENFWMDLVESYPSARVGRKMPRLWVEHLRACAPADLAKISDHLIDTRETFPSFAHVRKVMASLDVAAAPRETLTERRQRFERLTGHDQADGVFVSEAHREILKRLFATVTDDDLLMTAVWASNGLEAPRSDELPPAFWEILPELWQECPATMPSEGIEGRLLEDLPYDPGIRLGGAETPSDRYKYDEDYPHE